MFSFIKRIRNYFRKRYLFEAIQKVEEFSIENKEWRENADVTELHVDLLIENKELLDDPVIFEKLAELRFTSKFNNLKEVETYVSAFIDQSLPFVQGKVNGKPKIDNGKLERDPLRNVTVSYFLEASDGRGLFATLTRIKNICVMVKTHCSKVNISRQKILESICKDIFSPLLTILQEILEVLYANQTRKSS